MSERGSQRCFTDEMGLELFGLALCGEGDAPIPGPPCRFHHVYHGLMRGFGIGVNDDGGVGLIACSSFQRSCQRVYSGIGQALIVDGIVFRGIHCNVDDVALCARCFAARLRQIDLQFGELGVAGGHHHENQNHQQHVYHRDQVDLWFFAPTSKSEVHCRLTRTLAVHDRHQFDGLLLHLYGQAVHLRTKVAIENHAGYRHDQAEGGIV
jgi:hypothetical protein